MVFLWCRFRVSPLPLDSTLGSASAMGTTAHVYTLGVGLGLFVGIT